MFPVTRQVRRKRTPVFGRPGRTRGARMRPGERRRLRTEDGLGAEAAQRPGSGRSWVGSASEKRLRERAASGSGEARAWERAREGSGREQGGGLGEIVRSPTSKTHRWPPDGQAAHTGLCRFPGRTPGPPGNQRCDPAGPAAVAECRGRSAGTPILHGVRITRELRRARTSARLRTPRRCWREYARAH